MIRGQDRPSAPVRSAYSAERVASSRSGLASWSLLHVRMLTQDCTSREEQMEVVSFYPSPFPPHFPDTAAYRIGITER